jgi:hypothetical protein
MSRASRYSFAALTIAVMALAGCTPTTAPGEPSPSASATRTTTPEPEAEAEPARAAATCDNLLLPERRQRLTAAEFTLKNDWTGGTDGPFSNLKPFAERGGVVCIWGHPDYPEQPYAYAWSPIDAAGSEQMQQSFAAAGMTRSQTPSGVVFSGEHDGESDTFYGYLIRDVDWFYTDHLPDLEPIAAQFDAL